MLQTQNLTLNGSLFCRITLCTIYSICIFDMFLCSLPNKTTTKRWEKCFIHSHIIMKIEA